MPKIDGRLRLLIIDKIQDGDSFRNVSRELKICKTSVRNIWHKFLDTGSVIDRVRSGRLAKFSERDKRILCRQAKNEPFLSAQNIGVQSNLFSNVSVRTTYISLACLPE